MQQPSVYYTQQKDRFSLLLDAANKEISLLSRLRLWVALAGIGAIVWAMRGGNSWQWWVVGAVVAGFLVLVKRHTQKQEARKAIIINLMIVDLELRALAGDNSGFPDGGAYTNIAHPYTYDLDIFGKGSVYQALSRCVTLGGALLLKDRLSVLVMDKTTIERRQEIIAELSGQPDLLQAFRAGGMAVPEGPKDQERLTQWLESEDHFINNLLVRIAAIAMPVASLVFIGYSVYLGSMYSGLTLVLVANWILLGVFSKKIKIAAQQMGHSAPLVDKYESLLRIVAGAKFTHPLLVATGAEAQSSVSAIFELKKLTHLFESRSNGMTGPLMNTFFLFDFYCLLKMENWRKKHRPLLKQAITAMVETDVYVSCAAYAYNHPENIYPSINTTDHELKAQNLRHPLLMAKTAVGNDNSLGKKEQFYLLTGANMTGKSTFIRTIGVCNVLCNIGLPLPATSLSLPLLDLYTSMRITDSVQDDISYFRAELNRIKMIMDTVRTTAQPYLVLLDEPLRGTNSTDKQQGTRSIVETLLTCHAIGIVATHDTGLCDMADQYQGKVSNYHFESAVTPTGLTFDFRLKPGGSTSNNATILMRQMGIIN